MSDPHPDGESADSTDSTQQRMLIAILVVGGLIALGGCLACTPISGVLSVFWQ